MNFMVGRVQTLSWVALVFLVLVALYPLSLSVAAQRSDLMRVEREISRTRAPARDEPRSYLSIELLRGTADVVLVVTNLSGRGLDADEPDDHVRAFRLTVDRETE